MSDFPPEDLARGFARVPYFSKGAALRSALLIYFCFRLPDTPMAASSAPSRHIRVAEGGSHKIPLAFPGRAKFTCAKIVFSGPTSTFAAICSSVFLSYFA